MKLLAAILFSGFITAGFIFQPPSQLVQLARNSYSVSSSSHTSKTANISSHCLSGGALKLSSCKSGFQGAVEVFDMRYFQKRYGCAIQLNSHTGKIKTNYISGKNASQNVQARFHNWKKNRTVILSSSGAFTTEWEGRQKPLGLAIENGKVINKTLDKIMDGIVVINEGQIEVMHARQSSSLSAFPQQYHLEHDLDRNRFTRWCKLNSATVFQTQLLAYNNKLTISRKGKLKPAQRKFLCWIKGKGNKDAMLLFYIEQPSYLYDASKIIFDYLNQNNFHIEAMVNLDTGLNNILELAPSIQQCNNRKLKGRTAQQTAVNLLSFYLE